MTNNTESGIDPAVFAETERKPGSLRTLERIMQRVMAHPAKPEDGSENREPTREELNQRWKIARRS